MGAGLQHRFAVWKNPGLKLVRLASTTVDNQVQVTAEYDMKAVSAKLYLEYVINNQGAVKITQKMTADKMPRYLRCSVSVCRCKCRRTSIPLSSTDAARLKTTVTVTIAPIWASIAECRRTILLLHPSAGNRKQDRHPLVETVECRRQWREDCSRSSFLCLCIALHHRITG